MLSGSAFADEVSQDPQLQMDILGANGIRHIELRGAYGLNVMKLSEAQSVDLKRQFTERGFGVSCIASPMSCPSTNWRPSSCKARVRSLVSAWLLSTICSKAGSA